MSTITRETVLIDRRQPTLRWSAVFAGAACSVGFWLLLQVLGVGIGLTAHDAADRVSTMHAAQLGTTVWALVAQVIAAFFGGMVAGKLAQTYDRSHAGMHGLVAWALTSVVGLWATIWVITKLTVGADIAGDTAVTTTAPSVAAAGKALIVLGCSMLISLITSVLGAMAALRRPRHPGAGNVRTVRTTEPGYPTPHEPAVGTAPYPTPMTGPGTPVIPPSDVPR
jgi:hypothetical protein